MHSEDKIKMQLKKQSGKTYHSHSSNIPAPPALRLQIPNRAVSAQAIKLAISTRCRIPVNDQISQIEGKELNDKNMLSFYHRSHLFVSLQVKKGLLTVLSMKDFIAWNILEEMSW